MPARSKLLALRINRIMADLVRIVERAVDRAK
jgi:hypothetical protein